MSGFAGLFRRAGDDVTADELDAMVETLVHRGPNGRGTWREGPVGLGHQHLQTTPEAGFASLPEVGNNETVVLTMDARVDNRATLCDALGLADAPTLTDSQLLLAAYDRWGTCCFERIVGAFAVVLFDRERHRLVCARDATGIKPFYYTLRNDLFAFGSEPKAVLSLPDVSETVDDASVFAFLADEFDDPEATFYESVTRLPPAQVMVVSPDAVRKRTYWSLDPDHVLDLPSDEAYEQRFRELFTEAVRCRLRRPVGTKTVSYLSGGLDSTSIASVAQSLLGPEESLRTFSATYRGYPTSDESEYLRTALATHDFDACVKDTGGTSPFPNLDRRLAFHDAPIYPTLFVTDHQFSDELRDDDVRVLFDGVGGDQVLYYGTNYLTELFLTGRLVRFIAELNALARSRGISKRSLLFQSIAAPLAPWPVRRTWRRFHGTDNLADAYPIIDAEAATSSGFPNRFWDDDRLPPTDHREEHRRHIVDSEQTFFMEIYDVERAQFGVEPRYPYFDRRLVEFCLALPMDQKIRGGVGRHILRRSLRGILPEEIRTRTDKAAFSQSWVDGLHSHERDPLRERLVSSPQHVNEYVNDGLPETYQHFSKEPSYDNALPLINAYAVETWLRNQNVGR